MRSNIKIILLFLSLIRSLSLTAGTPDSLKQLLDKSTDTVRMRLLGEYGYELRKTDPEKAVHYINEAIKMSVGYNNQKFTARLHLWLGNVYLRSSEFDKGIECFLTSEKLFIVTSDSTGIANVYTGLGNAYGYKGDYNKSEEYTLKAIDISKKIKYLTGQAYNYSNLAIIYSDRGEYTKALKYHQLGSQTFEKMGSITEMASSTMNIAVLYQQMNDNAKAEEYIHKGLEQYKKINDGKGLSVAYFNLSALYYNLKKIDLAAQYLDTSLYYAKKANNSYCLADCYTMKCDIAIAELKFNEAITYGMEALNLKQEMQDMFGLAIIYRKLGLAYRETKQYSLSEEMLTKAITIFKDQGFRNALYMTYYQMAYTKLKLDDVDEGIIYFELFLNLKDSCNNEESMKTITEMQTRYESQQKEKENKLLTLDNELKKTENEKQKVAIIYMIIGLAVVLFFSFLLFRLLRQKQAANRILAKKNIEIAQQKEEILTQRDEIAAQRDLATNQRDIISHQQKDIKDSIRYAFQIQTALFPTDDDLRLILKDYFIFYRPRDIVSGDFYWVSKQDTKIIVVASDCTGHGVPGAFMSMLGVAYLNEIVGKENVTNPAQILNRLRENIILAMKQHVENVKQQDGMDSVAITIDRAAKTLEFAGANNPLYIVTGCSSLVTGKLNQQPATSNQKLIEVKGDKMPVSIYSRMQPFTNHTIPIDEGDLLYIFSDGFADQFGGPEGKKFKYKALKDLLIANSQQPMAIQKETLAKAFDEWKGDQTQIDDVLIIGIKI